MARSPSGLTCNEVGYLGVGTPGLVDRAGRVPDFGFEDVRVVGRLGILEVPDLGRDLERMEPRLIRKGSQEHASGLPVRVRSGKSRISEVGLGLSGSRGSHPGLRR